MIDVPSWTIRFRRSFVPGTVVHVLPGIEETGVIAAARSAGLKVQALEWTKWPFPSMVGHFIDGADDPTLVAGSLELHDALRDQIAHDINVHGAAVTEVGLSSALTRFGAIADIVARGRQQPGDTPQVIFEIKTGPNSEFSTNQSYIYALAMVGGHVTSLDARITKVGLVPGSPLPAMDLMLVCADGPGLNYRPYLFRASLVDSPASLALIIASIKNLR